MKKRNLIQIGLVIILLAGVGLFNTNSAMARNDCPGGFLSGGSYDEIVIDEFVNCRIDSAVITGNVQITGANQFDIIASSVRGELKVADSFLIGIINNQVLDDDLIVSGNAQATVWYNVVNGGSMLVNDYFPTQQEQIAEVRGNIIINGSLEVNGNGYASIKENNTRNGDITCENNDRLDSYRNNALGGSENCSVSLFD